MNAAKEHFSINFVRVITYAAGMWIKNHETDYDGVDITIASSTAYSIWDCPEFEKLTSPKRYNAAYLGILLLPNDAGPWLEQDESMLLTRSRMYWQRAADLGQLGEGSASKTVRLPRSNLFDVTAVQDMMRTIGEGSDR